jgi:hypothetical protein
MRRRRSHRERPFNDTSDDSDHGVKRGWRVLVASFVAGFAKTGYPTYIEKLHRDKQCTGGSSPKSKSHTYAVAGDRDENEKGESNMKTYIKPRLRCLGLLRLVTKFSF